MARTRFLLPFARWLALSAAGTFFVASCQKSSASTGEPSARPSATNESEAPLPGASSTAPVAVSDVGTGDAAATPQLSSLPGRVDGCTEGMVRVEGEYCPAVIQDCIEHHKEYDRNKSDKNVSERCLRYQNPSKCLSKEKKHLSFCMDRFEWPNKVGELPRVLTSWLEAKAMCEKAGKRLCTEDEFNFACEGPEILPYAYGFDRDATKCNIDRPYVRPDHSRQLPTYDKCDQNEFCASEMKRLDQRHAIGSRLTCLSWAGIVDINGNVNEWVEIPGEKHPNRSGLKGGWWGPVRSRCRPTVTFHKEFDYGYEAGFRCCADASGAGDGG